MIKLLVGLGNPGPEYAQTRHNAGFWWVDAAARQLGARLVNDRAYHGLVARVNRASGPLWLLEPQTYMNVSGKAVAALARFFKIAPQEILVVHDELDLPPGQLKLKQGGGHAGHNGLRDIHAQLGSPDYWRLRLGIGHPGVKAEVANYVLGKPPAAEREAIGHDTVDVGGIAIAFADEVKRLGHQRVLQAVEQEAVDFLAQRHRVQILRDARLRLDLAALERHAVQDADDFRRFVVDDRFGVLVVQHRHREACYISRFS